MHPAYFHQFQDCFIQPEKRVELHSIKSAIMGYTKEQIEAVRNRLRAEGITVSVLCREHNINHQAVRDLLCGKLVGHRGEAHRAAILLGLKPDPKTGKTTFAKPPTA